MPVYEYKRPDGSTFEIVQSFSDDPLTHDPDTGVPVQRVFHAPAVHFKGSGFYNTDYGTRKRQRESAAASAAEGSGGSPEKKDSSAATGSGDGAGNGKAGGEKSSPGGESAKSAKPAKDAKPVAAKT